MKNLTEVSKAVARIHGLSNTKALEITRTVLDCVKKGIVDLEKNSRDRVSLAEFGNFAVKATNARTVKNIRTGEPVEVPAGVRIVFKAADSFKTQVETGNFDLTVPEKFHKDENEGTQVKKAKKAPKTVEDEEIPDLDDLDEL